MDTEQRATATVAFVNKWRAATGREKQETHTFWIELLTDVYGATRAGELIGLLYDALAAEYRDAEGKRYGGEDAFKKRVTEVQRTHNVCFSTFRAI